MTNYKTNQKTVTDIKRTGKNNYYGKVIQKEDINILCDRVCFMDNGRLILGTNRKMNKNLNPSHKHELFTFYYEYHKSFILPECLINKGIAGISQRKIMHNKLI